MAEKLSSEGYARGGQIMILLFFIPFDFLLLYLGYKVIINAIYDSLILIVILLGASYFIIKNAFSYADLYWDENSLIIKKLFFTQKVPVSKYKKLAKAIMPFTYYIEFKNRQTVYFFLPLSGIFKEVASLNPDKVLLDLKMKFNHFKEEIPTANHT